MTLSLPPADLSVKAPPQAVLHGRDAERDILQGALQQARRSTRQLLWISGEAGVGKTALVRDLQQPVQRAQGIFALGKCEQFLGTEVLQAPRQALRRALSQLAARSQAERLALGEALHRSLGSQGGALLPLLPELAPFIAALPEPAPLEAHEVSRQLIHLLLALLRPLARLGRPLVLVLDDLHWADPITVELLGAVLQAPDLRGLLLIGLYRPADLQPEGPLRELLDQAAADPAPPLQLALGNLGTEPITALLSQRLQADPCELRSLSAVVQRSTGGNPFFVIAALDTLQREGSLKRDPGSGRWRWHQRALAERLSGRDVVTLLSDNLLQLPAASLELIQILACLGSQASLTLLAQASNLTSAAVAERLEPGLALGVLICLDREGLRRGEGGTLVGFGHDRLQQAVLSPLTGVRRQTLHLAIAQRLLAHGQRLLAAEHYAEAHPLLASEDERDLVVALLQDAGRNALSAGGFSRGERLLRLGWSLLGADPWEHHPGTAWQLCSHLHQLAYGRADYDAADQLYAALQRHARTPQALLEASSIQVMALSNRGRYQAAVALAADLLEQLGEPMPSADDRRLPEEQLWTLDRITQDEGLTALPTLPSRPVSGGSGARLINRLIPAAFFCEPQLACWLVMHSTRQWLAGDADPARLYPLACTLLASVALRGDYRSGYRAARAALSAGEASCHGLETARSRHVFSLFCAHWFEPLENGLNQARRAHRELRGYGEQEFACYTFYTSQAALLECGGSLGELAEENAQAIAFARSSGNRHAAPAYAAYTSLVNRLSDPDSRPLDPDPDSAPDSSQEQSLELSNPMAACYQQLHQALASCLLNDGPALRRHAEAASRLERYITGFYPAALIRLLQALALLWNHRSGRQEAESERLDALQSWFRARAADAPQNFAHLADLIDAERLWCQGRGEAALATYEQAMRGALAHQRPWHAALAHERAARCYLALGLERAGQSLMEQAHQHYRDWGATRKTAALEREYPFLGSGQPLESDESALLEACQSLGSLRTLPELVEQTALLVGRLSGATDVQILALDQEERWLLKGGVSPQGWLPRQPLEVADQEGLVPTSALRCCLEARQPLLCHDAVADPRFRGEAFLDGLPGCSLLVVPVMMQQRPIAAVIAAHRQMRGAFRPMLLRAIELLCGHLGVALENLLIQGSLEHQVRERSRALEQAYEREARNAQLRSRLLEQKLKTSLTAAAAVHEIQQPLASILLNCRLAVQSLRELPAGTIPEVLAQRLSSLTGEAEAVAATMERMRMLLRNVETEPSTLELTSTLDSALTFLQTELREQGIQVACSGLEHRCPLQGDRAQLQIAVVNLIRNAIQAMADQPAEQRRLSLKLRRRSDGIGIEVADSGPGFPEHFRGDHSWELLKSSKATGMGIGLLLAETTATNHHGRLLIGRSPELGGAEVTLELPWCGPAAGAGP